MEFFLQASNRQLIHWLKNDSIDRVAKNLSGYWPQHPSRVVAIGDVHGDWDALIQTLVYSGIIESKDNLNWKGGNTFVVQCGDILDRKGRIELPPNAPNYLKDDDSELRILAYLAWLDDQASEQGGRVLGVIGNHEWMNFTGDLSYTTKQSMKSFQNINTENPFRKVKRNSNGQEIISNKYRRNALDFGNWLAVWFSRNRYWIVQIQKWIFVHGGLFGDSPQPWYNALQVNRKLTNFTQNSLQKREIITQILRNVLTKQPLTQQQQQMLEPLINGVLYDRSVGLTLENRLPTRQINKIGEPNAWNMNTQTIVNSMGRKCTRTQHALHYFNANHLVVGHTPHTQMSNGCGGKVWRVDIMLSRAFLPSGGRKIGYLEITWNDKNEPTPTPYIKNRNYPNAVTIQKFFHDSSTKKQKI